jgi:hypothetical protein
MQLQPKAVSGAKNAIITAMSQAGPGLFIARL